MMERASALPFFEFLPFVRLRSLRPAPKPRPGIRPRGDKAPRVARCWVPDSRCGVKSNKIDSNSITFYNYYYF